MRKLRDFKCEDCGMVKERLVKDDIDKVNCPWCGGVDSAKRQLSAPAGSGNAAHGFMRKAK